MSPEARTCAICEATIPRHSAAQVCDDARCRWRYETTPPALLCPECGRLTRGDAVRLCVNRACLAERSLRQLEQVQRERAELEARALRFRDRAAAAAGVTEPATYPLLVVPSLTANLRPLPEERRTALSAHVTALFAVGTAAPSDLPAEAPPDLGPEAEALVGQACASCRGYCCHQGADHAYLNLNTARRVTRDHPGVSAEELVAGYLRAVGAQTYEGSCVYHGPKGCTLRRELRSDTCNEFFCPPITDFRATLPLAGPFRAFIVSVEEDFRAAFADGGRSRPVPPGERAGRLTA